MNYFFNPTKIYSGKESITHLNTLKNKRIFIICDEFLYQNQSTERLKAQLTSNEVFIYTDIHPDPEVLTIVSGMQQLIAFKPDVVIGFGGGSAIDAAKAMVFFAKNFNVQLEKCIAIPTTSGTGSEVTNVTVITDEKQSIKYPLFHNQIFPDEAILDPSFVITVPPNITANTGMDVLTHAIEAYVANNANDFSDALAEKSIALIFQYLPTAYLKGDCEKTREKLHNASCMAGMAFSQSGLGLNHAIAHQLGGVFHIPHGLANSLLLTHVIRFNAKHDVRAKKRYARIAKICGFCQKDASPDAAVNQLIHNIKLLQRKIKLPNALYELKISRKEVLAQLSKMTEAALKDATIKTTPFKASQLEIQRIIEALL